MEEERKASPNNVTGSREMLWSKRERGQERNRKIGWSGFVLHVIVAAHLAYCQLNLE